MGRLIDADKFIKDVERDRKHEIYLHSWTADMVLKRLDSWYAPTVEAIPKDQYEARLKADMVAMLTEIQLEIREHDPGCGWEGYADKNVIDCIIQERINSLKGE